MTRAEELADFCRWYNSRRDNCFPRLKHWKLADNDIKLKKMYVPAWDRKIILAAWVGGELVYDRREDG